MRYTPEAKAQLAEFGRYYHLKHRPEAIRNLHRAMAEARFRIEMGWSLPAPRPYPDMAREGEAWVHAGHYWVAHTTTKPVIILAIFYDTADMAGRR